MLRLSTSSDTESWRQVQNGEWFPISVGCRCHGRVHGEAKPGYEVEQNDKMVQGWAPWIAKIWRMWYILEIIHYLFEKLEIVVYTGKIYKVGPPFDS